MVGRHDTVTAEWTSTLQADPSRVMLFLYGGGYAAFMPASRT